MARPRGPSERRYTPEQKAEAIRLLTPVVAGGQGLSQRAAHARTGIPTSTMAAWYREDRKRAATLLAATDSPPGEPSPVEPPPGGEPKHAGLGPRRPADGKDAPPAPGTELDYASIESFIAGGYSFAADYVGERDPILRDAIGTHADAAGKAWAAYIQSNPKAAEFVRRMMIGTPAGEVIRVHAAIIIGYWFARSASLQLAREREPEPEPAPAPA